MTSLSSVNASIIHGVIFSHPHRVLKSPKSIACSSTLSVLSLNARSLKKHLEDLEALVSSLESSPDLLCLTETWLSENDNPQFFHVNGYKSVLSKNSDSKGGGVMVQISGNCAFQTTYENMLEESLAVKIEKEGYFFCLVVIYNKQRANKMEFIEVLDEMLSNFNSKTFPTVICGDFNIDTLKDNLLTQNYVNTINSNCFRLLPNEPTLVTDRFVSCIDHFIYQNLICDCIILEHQSFFRSLSCLVQMDYSSKN